MKSLKLRMVAAGIVLLAIVIVGMGVCLAADQKVVTILHIFGTGVGAGQVSNSVAQFEEANPDVKVEEIALDSAGWQPKLIQMLSGDTPPDVFLWYPGPKTYELADLGVLAPLTEMWETYSLDYFIPEGIKDEVSYKGDIWNLPWGYHPTVVLYNKRIFEALGLSEPSTIGEFEAICDTVKAAGYYPLASGWTGLWRSGYALELLIPSLGGPDFYSDLMALKVNWGNEICRDAYEIWKRWIEKGYWYPDPRSRRWPEGGTLLLNEECAMYTLGTYGVSMLTAGGWVLGKDFDAFLFPQENPEYPMTLTGPFDTWSMAAKAPHPAEAHRLLAFLATTGPQTQRAIHHGGLACNRFVTTYDRIGLMVRDAINSGAVFHQVIGNALPPLGQQLINKGAVPDFYDNPDIEEFINRCEEARAEYWGELGLPVPGE